MDKNQELTKYILTGGFRHVDAGISMEKALTFEKVIEQEVVKKEERAHSIREVLEIHVLTETSYETWWACHFGWGAGDDADDWIELFDKKEQAIKSYNAFE